jgi:hypothetical protein
MQLFDFFNINPSRQKQKSPNFEDDTFPGVYPLPTQGKLSALELSETPETTNVICS